jgi:predicted permease
MIGWLRRLFRREAMERELDRELAFHIEAQTQDLVRQGVAPDEARRQARVLIGGVEQVKEDARDARGTRWVEDWVRDTRQALRGMARSPGFTAAAVLTLAIGIGANTAVWSVVDALILRALPVEAPEEIHAVRKVGIEDDSYLMSYIRYQRLRRVLPDTMALSAMSSQASMYAIVGGRPVEVDAQLVSGNWFSLLGVGTQVGRPLGAQDDITVGAHPVAVLSEAFWRTHLGGDPSVVGRPLRVNGFDLTVVGIAESGFNGLTIAAPVDIWIPATMQHEVKFHGNSYSSDANTGEPWLPQYGVHWLTLVARVQPSALAAAQARLNTQYSLEQQEELRTSGMQAAEREARLRERLELEPLSRGFSGLRRAFADPLKLLFLSVGTILLIACGNLAGLLLARSAARTHEIAVRISLGARPGRLIRQVLTESMTLAIVGGALSILVAHWGSQALLRIASSGASAIALDVRIDARMLLFSLAVTMLAGMLFGLAPALRVARTDLYDSFKTGGRVVAGGGSHRLPLGRTLLVAQIALSLVLVTSAGLFVRTFQNWGAIDPGFDADQVVVARIDVLAAGYTGEQLPALYDRLTAAARAVPGVRSVGLSWLVLGGGGRSMGPFVVPGKTFARPGQSVGQVNYVTPEFFRTVGLPLLRGREFSDVDRKDSPLVAIVSERTARDFFGTLDVVGRRIGYGTPPEFEIVGVVRDARVNSIKEAPARLVFYPLAQGMRHITNVTVRASGSTDAVVPGLRNAIHSVDPNLPLRDAVAIRTLHERGLNRERMVARIAGALGLLALLLVGVGLYGVIAYSVSRRTNEMGVRLALGASARTVSWLVLRDSLTVIGMGIALGAVLAQPALKLTRRLVFGIEPHDPQTLGAAITLLLAVGVLAAIIPAWRAARIDPIEAIRAE